MNNLSRIFNIDIDLCNVEQIHISDAKYSHLDYNSDILTITLFNNGDPITIPDIDKTYIIVKDKKANKYILKIASANDNVLTIDLEPTSFKLTGTHIGEIHIIDKDSTIVSPRFIFEVCSSFDGSDAEEAKEKITYIDNLILDVKNTSSKIEEYSKLIDDSSSNLNLSISESKKALEENKQIIEDSKAIKESLDEFIAEKDTIDNAIAISKSLKDETDKANEAIDIIDKSIENATNQINNVVTESKHVIENERDIAINIIKTAKGMKGDRGEKGERGQDGMTGPKGEQGIQGERGLPGKDGVNGRAFTFNDLTPEQLNLLKGAPGITGPQGPQGMKGDKGDVGPEGKQGPQGEVGPAGPKGEQGAIGKNGLDGKDGKSFTYEDFTQEQLSLLKGRDGAIGPKGDQGPIGLTGPKGDKGEQVTEIDWNKITNKTIDFIQEYTPDATTYIKNGFVKTNYTTKGLPDRLATWGVLQCVYENTGNGTGVQYWYPCSGGSKGKIYTRMLELGKPTDWSQITTDKELDYVLSHFTDTANNYSEIQTFNSKTRSVCSNEALTLEPTTAGQSVYVSIYKDKKIRSGFIGHESSSNDNFVIASEVTGADLNLKTSGGKVQANGKELATKEDLANIKIEGVGGGTADLVIRPNANPLPYEPYLDVVEAGAYTPMNSDYEIKFTTEDTNKEKIFNVTKTGCFKMTVEVKPNYYSDFEMYYTTNGESVKYKIFNITSTPILNFDPIVKYINLNEGDVITCISSVYKAHKVFIEPYRYETIAMNTPTKKLLFQRESKQLEAKTQQLEAKVNQLSTILNTVIPTIYENQINTKIKNIKKE